MKTLTLIQILISIFLLGKIVNFLNQIDENIDPIKKKIVEEYSVRFCASLATAQLNLKDALTILETELPRQNLEHLLPQSREKFTQIKIRLESHQQQFRKVYAFDCEEIFVLGEFVLRKEKNSSFDNAWPNWIYQLNLWSTI